VANFRRHEHGHGGSALALAPAYRTGAAGPTPALRAAHQAALALRRQHPSWGGGLIRVWLRRQGYQPLPARRTLHATLVPPG
jgi:hypothetical protein